MSTPRSWLTSAQDSQFGVHNLPYGVFTAADRPGQRRIGVRVGDFVLDAGAAARAAGAPSALLDADSLNPLMAAGRSVWTQVRNDLTTWLTDESFREALSPALVPVGEVELHLPFEVADYVDFYASEHHATNLGRIFRPGSEPLTPNWKHLPIGYHGRAGTVVVSGTPVVRPHGQRKAPADTVPSFGPSPRPRCPADATARRPAPIEPPLPRHSHGAAMPPQATALCPTTLHAAQPRLR